MAMCGKAPPVRGGQPRPEEKYGLSHSLYFPFLFLSLGLGTLVLVGGSSRTAGWVGKVQFATVGT
jgi:hypothetical protein